jgi:hypothetical protein
MPVNMVPCHHGMARPQVADGGDSRKERKIAVKVLTKQSRTAEKGRSFSLIVGRVNAASYKVLHRATDLYRLSGTI